MRRRSLVAALALLLVQTISAFAAPPMGARIRAAYADWLATQGAPPGVLAIRWADGRVEEHDFGRDPAQPVQLASLSKAITAQCVARLVEEGRLSWGSALRELLPGVAAVPDVMLAEAVVHTSGLAPDGTQIAMTAWLDTEGDRAADVLRLIAVRKGNSAERGSFFYNNENYALLALVIERVTGHSSEAACRARVLDPIGVAGQRSPRMGGSLAWAGWEMRAGDYARFHAHWFTAAAEPARLPHMAFDKSARYGLGVYWRKNGIKAIYHHSGLLCFGARLARSSYVLNWQDQLTIVAAQDFCASEAELSDLGRVLEWAVMGL